uniref:Uncharacterized protein n=1 Tax=Rhizophora mucronata TaxID=61149 RepID=A0A2P2NYT1_RHIMU
MRGLQSGSTNNTKKYTG